MIKKTLPRTFFNSDEDLLLYSHSGIEFHAPQHYEQLLDAFFNDNDRDPAKQVALIEGIPIPIDNGQGIYESPDCNEPEPKTEASLSIDIGNFSDSKHFEHYKLEFSNNNTEVPLPYSFEQYIGEHSNTGRNFAAQTHFKETPPKYDSNKQTSKTKTSSRRNRIPIKKNNSQLKKNLESYLKKQLPLLNQVLENASSKEETLSTLVRQNDNNFRIISNIFKHISTFKKKNKLNKNNIFLNTIIFSNITILDLAKYAVKDVKDISSKALVSSTNINNHGIVLNLILKSDYFQQIKWPNTLLKNILAKDVFLSIIRKNNNFNFQDFYKIKPQQFKIFAKKNTNLLLDICMHSLSYKNANIEKLKNLLDLNPDIKKVLSLNTLDGYDEQKNHNDKHFQLFLDKIVNYLSIINTSTAISFFQKLDKLFSLDSNNTPINDFKRFSFKSLIIVKNFEREHPINIVSLIRSFKLPDVYLSLLIKHSIDSNLFNLFDSINNLFDYDELKILNSLFNIQLSNTNETLSDYVVKNMSEITDQFINEPIIKRAINSNQKRKYDQILDLHTQTLTFLEQKRSRLNEDLPD